MKLCVDCIHVSVCYRQGAVDLNYADKCGDYEPSRRKGHWIKKEDDICWWYECSECNHKPLNMSNYCPYCGAEMESEE